MFKRFFTKTRITLITILSLLSITSVGFASWTITAFDVDEEVVGSLESDIVINSKEYVYLDTQKGDLDKQGNKLGFNTFDFYEYGYLDETGYFPTSTGYINAYFELDVAKCYEMFGPDGLNFNSIDIIIRLGYADTVVTSFNIFAEEKTTIAPVGNRSVTAELKDLSEEVDYSFGSTPNNKEFQYSKVLSFKNIIEKYQKGECSSQITFTIQYAFIATLGDYFYQNVFGEMFKSDIKPIDFNISLYVAGSDKNS